MADIAFHGWDESRVAAKMCFFHVGVMLKNLRDENRELKRRLDGMLLKDDEDRKKAY